MKMKVSKIENEDEDPNYNFNTVETVIFDVVVDNGYAHNKDWTGFGIDHIQVMTPDGQDLGAASYECDISGLFDYTIMAEVECPKKIGVYAVECQGHYIRGEWGYSDDDIDWYFGEVRPATEQEVMEFY